MDVKKIVLLVGALPHRRRAAIMPRKCSRAPPRRRPRPCPRAAPQGPEVLVATRTLPVGPSRRRGFPLPALAAGSGQGRLFHARREWLRPQSLIATVVRNEISAGQPLSQGASSVRRARLPRRGAWPGLRAVTVPVSATSGVAGFVFPGDRVDLVLTQEVTGGGEGAPLRVSETIIRNIRVLAVDQRLNARDEAGNQVAQPSATVTFEATPKIAEKIAVAQTIGQLSLSLRSLRQQCRARARIASGEVRVPENATRAPSGRCCCRSRAGRSTPIDLYVEPTSPASAQQRARRAGQSNMPRPLEALCLSRMAAVRARGPVVRIARGNLSLSFRWEHVEMSKVSKISGPKSALPASRPRWRSAWRRPRRPRPWRSPSQRCPTNDVTLSVGAGRMVGPTARSSKCSSPMRASPTSCRSPARSISSATAGEHHRLRDRPLGPGRLSANVRVGQNLGSVSQMLELAMPEATSRDPDERMVLLTGTVAQPTDAAEAERLVQAFVGANVQVVSRLRTATPQQVYLQVRIAEVSRSLARDIAHNLLSRDNQAAPFGIGRGNAGTIETVTAPGRTAADRLDRLHLQQPRGRDHAGRGWPPARHGHPLDSEPRRDDRPGHDPGGADPGRFVGETAPSSPAASSRCPSRSRSAR